MKLEKHTFTTSDGVTLAYFELGSGERTALFLAGYGAPAISWCLQMRALARAGIRCIALDRRCHGLSEVTPKGMDMLTHGRDVHELIEHLGLSGVILVGQSQGANTAWSYVSQFGTGALAAVVAVDQTPKMINEGDWRLGMYGLTPETRPTYFDAPLDKPNRKPIDPRIIAYLLLHGRGYPKFDMALTRPLLLDHADADWRGAIASCEVPALFIAGSESPFWPSAHAGAMAALAPKGSAWVVIGSGHAVNWECPGEFNAVLLNFIRGL